MNKEPLVRDLVLELSLSLYGTTLRPLTKDCQLKLKPLMGVGAPVEVEREPR